MYKNPKFSEMPPGGGPSDFAISILSSCNITLQRNPVDILYKLKYS